MLYPLTTLLLLPWLLWQGRRVRRDTPRLPEPDGPREGVSGSGTPLAVLMVGDSAAAGVGTRVQTQALSGQLVQALAQRFQVRWQLLARTGDSSADVCDRLAAQSPRPFDLALVSVGVNDVTGRTTLRQWHRHLQQLTGLLQQRFGVREVVFTAIPPMHQFPALPQPLRWYLGRRAGQLNQALAQFCRDTGGCSLLQVPFPFEPGLMASDGFHPGEAAYALWGQHGAELLADLHVKALSDAPSGASSSALSGVTPAALAE